MLGHLIKTMKLVYLIISISYFVGIFWHILCQLIVNFHDES